jgi:cytochrome c-type biogenesis protein CcsB
MNLELFFIGACIFCLVVSMTITVVHFIKNRRKGDSDPDSKPGTLSRMEKASLAAAFAGILSITALMIARALKTGHGPFTSMYEFAIAFAWGVLIMGIFFSLKYRNVIIHFAGMIVAAGLLIYAGSQSTASSPLVPALQSSFLLSVHVLSAVIAYGAFTIGLISSVFLIINRKHRFPMLPDAESLERISYHSVIIGFPFMTLVIVLGAIWADLAWGRYWGWDPKETASLVTWLLYAGYLHTRITMGWKGQKSAWMLIIGFIAVIFTFFGNYLFSGLHAYG